LLFMVVGSKLEESIHLMQLGISEILEKASKIEDRAERVAYLKSQDSNSLRIVLSYTYHPAVQWLVGPELPKFHDEGWHEGKELILLAEARRLYLFVNIGNSNLTDAHREKLFVQLLEMLHPNDVRILESAIKKSLPYPNLEYDVIWEAFDGLLPETNFRPQVETVQEKVDQVIPPTELDGVLDALPPKQEKPKRTRKKGASKTTTP